MRSVIRQRNAWQTERVASGEASELSLRQRRLVARNDQAQASYSEDVSRTADDARVLPIARVIIQIRPVLGTLIGHKCIHRSDIVIPSARDLQSDACPDA